MQRLTNWKNGSESNTLGLRHAAGLVLAAGTLASAHAQNISWTGGDGMWSNAANWSLGHTPDGNENIYIGNLPGVSNSTVLMSFPGSGYDNLYLSSGMTLDTNGGELVSFGEAWLSGANTRLIVRKALGPNMNDFSGELHLGAGTFLDLRDNAPVVLWTGSESSGTITGQGNIQLGNNFSNSGVIRPGANGGLVLDAAYFGVQGIDLDGTSGAGKLQLDTPFSQLHVLADHLTDSFSGGVIMAPGALLTMDIAQGWVADSASYINVTGLGNPAAQSTIAGTALTFGGTMRILGADGRLQLLADTTFVNSARVEVDDGGRAATQSAAIVEGGVFQVGQGGQINFNGSTTMKGGEFTTASASLVDGGVYFNSNTDWQGTTTFNGAARQNGNATVTGSLGAAINADLFDMDGTAGGNSWQINGPLTVNADRVGTTAANVVDSDITVVGGFLPKLAINLTNPNDSWTMAGSLSLNGFSHLFETKLSGSKMMMQGDMAVNGLVQVSADTTFRDAGIFGNASVNIGLGDTLRMQGETRIQQGVDFMGEGNLVNGVFGSMLIADGVSLNSVGLSNSGQLQLGDAAGVASVDRFAQAAGGTWNVSLGGYLAGDEYDQLLVGGGLAELDGTLEVSFLKGLSGYFDPNVGDEFVILTALGGVSGSFASVADTVWFSNGKTYEWSVLYNPNDVVLRLESIVPAPGAMALFGLGLGLACRRRPLRV